MNIKNYFIESSNVIKSFIEGNEIVLNNIIHLIINCLTNWNKIMICWNWWSAADSQHFAAELICRYKKNRNSLPAIALTTDTSALTAIWNDFGFYQIFSRQVEWLWKYWDILICFSTSWNSENIVKAIKSAKDKWIITIWLLWKWWWILKNLIDHALIVPSDNTPRIQECHSIIYHTICEVIDEQFCNV